jgi:hypothetical protein
VKELVERSSEKTLVGGESIWRFGFEEIEREEYLQEWSEHRASEDQGRSLFYREFGWGSLDVAPKRRKYFMR